MIANWLLRPGVALDESGPTPWRQGTRERSQW